MAHETHQLEARFLCVQEVLCDGRFAVEKVHGTKHPADMLTKLHSASDMAPALDCIGERHVRRS